MKFLSPNELRKFFSEGLGTFFLVLVAVGGKITFTLTNGSIGYVASVVCSGLMVMAIILFMGKVSGAHLNPVVTIGFALRKDFNWRHVPGYITAQTIGGIIACLFLVAATGIVGNFGVTEPGPGIGDFNALAIEVVLTIGLVTTILGTASRSQNIGPLSALAVGGYISLASLWADPLTGASMNPVRSLAPALFTSNFNGLWLYIIGPLLGSIIAVGFAYLLRGPGGDQPAKETAQGTLK